MDMPSTNAARSAGAEDHQVVIGLVVDHGATPTEVGEYLQNELAGLLTEHVDDTTSWEVRASHEPLPAGKYGHASMFDVGQERLRERGWDLTICITDLPMRSGRRPVVAEASMDRGTAVVSLPAFGVMRLQRRVSRVVVQLIAELLGRDVSADFQPSMKSRRRPQRWLSGRFDRVDPDDSENVDVRITASRGTQRMLVGMVRANQPWLVAFGLTGATAGSLAFSAFYLLSSTLWELSNQLGPVRLSLATLSSLTVLVSWLIIRHGLWESPRRADLPHERYEVRLFNASTVLTLAIGMLCMYVALLLMLFAAAWLILDDAVLSTYVGGSVGFGTYANIAWLATSAAGIAGALGSSFDSEAKVRQAAYSYREHERRAQREQERQSEHSEDQRESETSAQRS